MDKMSLELLETAAYWVALANFGEKTICVMREFEKKPCYLRLDNQKHYKEWNGCFSLINNHKTYKVA
jgi:hypothetical protein